MFRRSPFLGAAEGLVLATKVVAASMTSRMGMDLLPAVGMAAPPAAAMDPQAVGTEVVVGIATTSSVAMGRVVTTIEIPKDHGTNPMVICRGISGYLVRHIFCQGNRLPLGRILRLVLFIFISFSYHSA